MLRDVVPPCSWNCSQSSKVQASHVFLCFFQPLCVELASRKWLSGAQLVNTMCEVIDKYAKDFSRVKKPLFKVPSLQGFSRASSDQLLVSRAKM